MPDSHHLPEKPMPKPLTPAQCRARAEALEECADHLLLTWTDDETEREQGDVIGRKLRAECEHFRTLAMRREFGVPSFPPSV